MRNILKYLKSTIIMKFSIFKKIKFLRNKSVRSLKKSHSFGTQIKITIVMKEESTDQIL